MSELKTRFTQAPPPREYIVNVYGGHLFPYLFLNACAVSRQGAEVARACEVQSETSDRKEFPSNTGGGGGGGGGCSSQEEPWPDI